MAMYLVKSIFSTDFHRKIDVTLSRYSILDLRNSKLNHTIIISMAHILGELDVVWSFYEECSG